MNVAIRYYQLTAMIQRLKPRTILEVGTWRGDRAIQMVRASGNMARYIGFDMFEDATGATDKDEHNVKKHYTLDQVEGRLREAGLVAELIRGDSNTTIPKYVREHGEGWLDFAFIDGGHSLTTMRSDWAHVKKMLKPGGVAVLDDYYRFTSEDEGPGCNKVIDKDNPVILPIMDKMKSGREIRLAVVTL